MRYSRWLFGNVQYKSGCKKDHGKVKINSSEYNWVNHGWFDGKPSNIKVIISRNSWIIQKWTKSHFWGSEIEVESSRQSS